MKKILVVSIVSISFQYGLMKAAFADDMAEEMRIRRMQMNLDSMGSNSAGNDSDDDDDNNNAPIAPPKVKPEENKSTSSSSNSPKPIVNNPTLLGTGVGQLQHSVSSPQNTAPKTSTTMVPLPVPVQEVPLDTRIHEAVSKGSEERCLALIQENIDLESRDKDGNTPLHLACQFGYRDICALLLVHNASPIAINNKGRTPLHCAAIHNDVELMKLLAVKTQNIDIPTVQVGAIPLTTGDTPLHLASAHGNDQVCTFLLSRGANPDALNSFSKTPFDNAFNHEDLSVAKVFGKGSMPEIIRRTIRSNRPKVLARLLSESKNLEKDLTFSDGASGSTTALHTACALGGSDNGDLSQGIVASYRKIKATPVDFASGMNQSKMLRMLLEEGGMKVDVVDSYGRTPLHVATEWGQEIACMTLVEKQASLKKSVTHHRLKDRSFTPLTLAAIYNHEPLVRIYLDKIISQFGNRELANLYPTILAAAIDNSSVEVVKLLLSYKNRLELSKYISINCYPLHRACVAGSIAICKMLINDGANPEETMNVSSIADKNLGNFWQEEDNEGITPLHCAAYAGQLDICDLLLRRNVSINSRSNQGRTPLAFAWHKNHDSISKFLLSKNAEITVEALELAPVDLCQLLLDTAGKRFNSLPKDEIGVREREQSIEGLLRKKDSAGKTLLHREAERGNFEKCACLLDHFASVKETDNEGRTPVHLVCNVGPDGQNLRLNKYLRTIQVLVEDDDFDEEAANLKDVRGHTALSLACKGGTASILAIKMLLDAGSNPDFINTSSSGFFSWLKQEEPLAPELVKLFADFRAK